MEHWVVPRDAGRIRFVVANGVSANRYRFAELSGTADELGYRPTDDAWTAL